MDLNRSFLAQLIIEKLSSNFENLKSNFRIKGQINSCYLDDLLPDEICHLIYEAFPSPNEMASHKSIRENKNVAAQMDKYNPLLEEIVFAFQDPKIVELIGKITGLEDLMPDENLYAGGISLMSKGNFLNPHLDNSHDNERKQYRVLNLLYYVTPNWELNNGGNLELWDYGISSAARTIHAKFNRLVIMITNKSSIHSVSKVVEVGNRCCVSNYYFSNKPAENCEYFHVTSFYGRPNEPIKKIVLTVDNFLRQLIRKIYGKRITETKHIYKKSRSKD